MVVDLSEPGTAGGPGESDTITTVENLRGTDDYNGDI